MSAATVAGAPKPRRFTLKKTAKFLLFGLAALIALGWIASAAWTASGDDQWKLELDKDGVQVYSYKAPGSFLKQFKGVRTAKYSQSQIAAALLLDNDSLDNCRAWIPICTDLKVVERYDPRMQGDAILWTLTLPGPFTKREFLIKTHVEQDPVDKNVYIDVMADAHKRPLDDCCLRIVHIHNRWQLAPKGNGEIEIQLTQDNSMGGFFPELLVNLTTAQATHQLLSQQLPALVEKDRYRNARFDFIDEPGAQAAVAAR
ncbi:hypothetical protein ABIE09_000802 [Lysobacter enzymogenes]|uniref:hypothetical protein n=1 Tax=Lysobacter enzymogenes TaxID=69 RepID=UPI0033940A55